jgi:hypothetical protein
MRHDEIPDELRPLVYDFFFWFSRFEYALKEARMLKKLEPGENAEADWTRFVNEHKDGYQIDASGKALIAANPQRQIVTGTGLDFRDVGFNPGASELERVTILARTVRNNLFHGGKHGSAYWNDANRMRLLLQTTISVLDSLAEQMDLNSDYRSEY